MLPYGCGSGARHVAPPVQSAGKGAAKVIIMGSVTPRRHARRYNMMKRRIAVALAMVTMLATSGLLMAQSNYNDPNATPSNPESTAPSNTNPPGSRVEPQDTYSDRTRTETNATTTRDTYNREHENMPRTASPMPLIGVIGGLLIGAGLLLEILSRRAAKNRRTDVSNQ